MITEEISKLSTAEKIILVQDIWDDIRNHPDTIDISEDQKLALDTEYQEFLANPSEGRSWSEVKKDILNRL